MGKYLKSVGRSEFISEIEAKKILGQIVETYNSVIASDHNRLDNSSIESKTSWFNSVEIKFQTSAQRKKVDSNGASIRKATKELVNYYDDLFPFLPEGAVIHLILAGPALEAYGYSLERFNKLINGDEPTPIEEDLLLWAYDLTSEILDAYMKKNKSIKDKLFSNAIQIAKTKLDEKTSIETVAKIYVNIQEQFADLDKNSKN